MSSTVGWGWGVGHWGHNSIKMKNNKRKWTHVRHEQIRAPVDKCLLLEKIFACLFVCLFFVFVFDNKIMFDITDIK